MKINEVQIQETVPYYLEAIEAALYGIVGVGLHDEAEIETKMNLAVQSTIDGLYNRGMEILNRSVNKPRTIFSVSETSDSLADAITSMKTRNQAQSIKMAASVSPKSAAAQKVK